MTNQALDPETSSEVTCVALFTFWIKACHRVTPTFKEVLPCHVTERKRHEFL